MARGWKLRHATEGSLGVVREKCGSSDQLGHYSIKKGPDIRAFFASSWFGKLSVVHSLTLRRFRYFGSGLPGWRCGGKYVGPFESHDAGYKFSSPIFIEVYDSVHVIDLADRS
jgi:hypothetical protein